MAGKARDYSGFNLSAAVREALAENPDYTGPEVKKCIETKNPGIELDKDNVGVAVSKQKKKLGIVPTRPFPNPNASPFLETLDAAKVLLDLVSGDEGQAFDAIRAVKRYSQ